MEATIPKYQRPSMEAVEWQENQIPISIREWDSCESSYPSNSAYIVSVFLLPMALCKDINSMMQQFWWCHKDSNSKIHLMSWKKFGSSNNRGDGLLRADVL